MKSEVEVCKGGRRAVEERLRDLWAELLAVSPSDISPQSSFYELGGNSMLALSMEVAITATFELGNAHPQRAEEETFADQVDWICRAEGGNWDSLNC